MHAETAMPDIGPYRVERLLGRGGAGHVFLGTHTASGERVAIKRLGFLHREDRLAKAFRREVGAALQVQHPGAITVLDAGWVGQDGPEGWAGHPWLATELASGSLAEGVGTLAWGEIRQVLLDLLAVLAHAHARGLTHLDVKPANLLKVGDRYKLGDFGLAQVVDPDGEEVGGGTPTSMAPEQWRKATHQLGPWTDLYAVGCTAWELVTGLPPFDAPHVERLRHLHLTAEPDPLRPIVPIPPGLDAWLAGMLEKRPEDRFRRAADAARALVALAEPVDRVAPGPLGRRSGAGATCSFDDETLDLDAVVTLPSSATAVTAHAAPPPDEWGPEPPVQTRSGPQVLMRRPWPLVGRAGEQDVLWGWLVGALRERSCRAVRVTGPKGVGCSALARRLAERASELGTADAILATFHDPPGRRDGLVAALARHLRTWQASDPRPQVAAGVSLPASLPGLLSPATAPQDATAADRRRWVLEALEALAVDRPLVVVLDDGGCSEEALDLVEAAIGRPAPILLVLTGDEQRGRTSLGVSELPLKPLRELDLTETCRALGLSRSAAAAVASGSHGLPGLAAQRLATWGAAGRLVPGPDGLELADREGGDTTWAEVSLRFAPDATVRRALACAAVQGDDVDLPVWRAAAERLGAGDHVDPLLGALEEAGLLLLAEDVPTFASPAFREAVLAGFDAGEVRAVVAAVAQKKAHEDWEAERFVPSVDRFELARAMGGLSVEGEITLGDALRRSRRTDDARAVLRGVIDRGADGARFALARALGNLGILELTSRRQPEAEPALRAAAAIYGELQERARRSYTLSNHALCLSMMGRIDEAIALYDEAESEAMAGGRPDRALIPRVRRDGLWMTRASLIDDRGRPEAEARLAERIRDGIPEPPVRRWAVWALIEWCEAVGDHERLEQLVPELRAGGSTDVLFDVELLLASRRGDLDLMERLVEHSAPDSDDRIWQLLVWAEALLRAGERDRARPWAETAVDDARRGGEHLRLLWALEVRSRCEREAARRRPFHEEAFELATRLGFATKVASLALDEGLACAEEGRTDRAAERLAVAERAIEGRAIAPIPTLHERRARLRALVGAPPVDPGWSPR